MDSREKNILDAAVRCFSRFGVKRTSMNDLADEAGISRQTLYKAYCNKDEVLRALIRHHTDLALADIRDRLDDCDNLGARLDAILDRMAVAGFDLVARTPNAQDIVDGFNEAGKEELEQSAERFQQVIAGVLSPFREALKRHGMDVDSLSKLVQRTAKAASAGARNRDELIAQLTTLRQLCVTACKAD